jgi:hypothetical protein
MRKYFLSLIFAVVLLGFAVAGWAAGSGNPDPSDRFDAIASMMLQPVGACQSNLGPFPIMADLTGLTAIKFATPKLASPKLLSGRIPVEILSLNLIGGGTPDPSDSFFDVFARLNPTRMSGGQIGQDSFFDVFFDLEITDPNGVMLTLRSVDPVHLMGMINEVFGPMDMPGSGLLETRFNSGQPVLFFLPSQDSQTPPSPCVELTRTSYVPVNPSAAIIKRELIQIEKKLDRLLKLNEPTVPPIPCDGPCPPSP